MHWDTLYLLDSGKRLFTGGTLVQEVFDPNPPLIFYFSMLLNAIAAHFFIPAAWLITLFQYLVIIYSLLVSYWLLPFQYRDRFVTTLGFCLLILPINIFVEREHLMLALSLPYFLLFMMRVEQHDFNPLTKIVIPAIAAVGFCLKPYFFLSFITAELLGCYWQRDWRWLWRAEVFVVLIVTSAYLVLVWVYIPDYYTQIMPQVIQWYAPNRHVLFAANNAACMLLLLFLCHFVGYVKKASRFEYLLVFIALAFALSFLIQGKGWFYQALPFITVLFLLIFGLNITPPFMRWFLKSAAFVLILLPTTVLYYQHQTCYQQHNCPYHPLLMGIQKHDAKQKHVFFFTTLMSESQPALSYSLALNSSRFPYMWLLSGVINREQRMGMCDVLCQQTKRSIRSVINDDLARFQPELIFIDIRPHKAYLAKHFDYVLFMKQSSRFNRIWMRYQYVETIHDYAVYQKRLANPSR